MLPGRFSLLFCTIALLSFGIGSNVYSQSIQISGIVTSYKSKKVIPATVIFEKQPDASVTIISASDSDGYHARIYYRVPYTIKISSPGFITDFQEIDLNSDSLKDRSEFSFHFSLVPIQIGEVLPFRDLLFDVKSYKITDSSIPELKRLVEILIENPSIIVQLEGHTDTQGKSRKARKLAMNRIRAIRAFLLSNGISSKRIKLKANLGQHLVTSGDVPDPRRANRRVEIRIIEI
jgi:outer membrane protein OmpA-like peptidoglycan-associated protein